VERRGRLASGAVFDGAGKRAAFALFYGPLHFLLVREIVRALGAGDAPPATLLDLGCGTGTAGAAWALETGGRTALHGIDRNGWALGEARWNAARLGLKARFTSGDLVRATFPTPGAVLLAFTVNELEDPPRSELLERLLAMGKGGGGVLVIEPLARGVAPWWDAWAGRFAAMGGRADEWRFKLALPPTLRLLDKAAGLDHHTLTGRSLYLAPRP
jgi:SAM-dependent methyltransferase